MVHISATCQSAVLSALAALALYIDELQQGSELVCLCVPRPEWSDAAHMSTF